MAVEQPVTTRYDAVGRCIYCDRDNVKLSDEHIIPDGLGGRMILPKASCNDCAAVTSRFERSVLRGAVWPLRQALGMRGKKRVVPPLVGTVSLDEDGKKTFRELPHNAIGFKGALPVFGSFPGILIDAPVSAPWSTVDFDVFFDAEALGLFQQPGTMIDIDLGQTARLLAKIGHSYAVAQLGISGFKPFLKGVILGHDPNIPHYVGAANCPRRGAEDFGHSVTLFCCDAPKSDMLVARIKLFANFGGPEYDVCVGRTLP